MDWDKVVKSLEWSADLAKRRALDCSRVAGSGYEGHAAAGEVLTALAYALRGGQVRKWTCLGSHVWETSDASSNCPECGRRASAEVVE